MCGIVGVVTKSQSGLFLQQQDTFLQMLYADALRGDDSTGVVCIENDSTFYTAKEAVSAEFFIYQMRNNKDVKILEPMIRWGKAFIGHNRKKTVGTVSDETAHPFVVNNEFAMVHNGTLHNHQALAKTQVDSEALAIHLHTAFEEGDGNMEKLKEALNNALGKVYGAYAVAIYDQKRHCVHLLRNKERPLCLIETDNAWYFMSEPLMGAWILSRNNYKSENLKAELIPEHMLVTFELETNKISREQLDPKKFYTSSSNTQQDNAHRGWTRENADTSAKKGGKFLLSEKELKKFRKSHLGKRVSFWVSDILEDNIFSTIEKGETKVSLFGTLEDVEYHNTVTADVDLAELGIQDRETIHQLKWSGIIDEIKWYNNGVLSIDIRPGCKPIAPSIPTKKEEPFAQASKKFRDQLGTMSRDELESYYEENKHSMQGWQITACYNERSWRDSIQSLERASAIAKEHGCYPLIQKMDKDNRMWVYQNSDGRIYYESPITVH